MAKRVIGLALGGGAARGWAHIGVLEVLNEAGVEANVVCGTSIGSIVGAAWLAGRLEALKEFAEHLNVASMIALIDIKLNGGGLLDGKRIVAKLRQLGIDRAIDAYRKPYAAIATDLESGTEIWLRAGAILDAIRASIALPGLIAPVRFDGRWLADGGLVNPVPVSTCRALGADVVIAVNLNGGLVRGFQPNGLQRAGDAFIGGSAETVQRLVNRIPPKFRPQLTGVAKGLLRSSRGAPGYIDVIVNSLNIMQDRLTRTRLAGEPPQVLIEPPLRHIGLLEFNRAAEAIAEGRAAATRALPEIERLLA